MPSQNVENEERDDPLAIGWALHDVMAAIAGADGLDIFAARIGEVAERVRPSELAQAANHVFGDGSGVKSVSPARGDPLQSVRQRFLAMDAAEGRRLAIDQKQATGVGILAEKIGLAGPVEMDPLGHRVAVARQMDGRLQHVAERPGAMVVQQLFPGIDGARNGDGERRNCAGSLLFRPSPGSVPAWPRRERVRSR